MFESFNFHNQIPLFLSLHFSKLISEMEATAEDLGLLSNIRPPSLEDAVLEDCALPAASIHEAFLKAAASVGSRAASILTGVDDLDDGGCVTDPLTEKSPPSDALLGITPERGPPGPCVTGKGGALAGDGDSASDVVGGGRIEGEDEKKDDVVVVGGEGGGEGGDCVDGLSGLEIKEKKQEREDEDEDKEGDKRPILVEGYFNP